MLKSQQLAMRRQKQQPVKLLKEHKQKTSKSVHTNKNIWRERVWDANIATTTTTTPWVNNNKPRSMHDDRNKKKKKQTTKVITTAKSKLNEKKLQ